MQGSQDARELEQPYVNTQASLVAWDTLMVDTNGLYNITNVRPEFVPMVTSPVTEALLAQTSPLKK